MKKMYFAALAAATLALGSCSQNEVLESVENAAPKAIEFGTYVGKTPSTRGDLIETDATLQSKGFGVFASVSTLAASGNFMDNVNVTYSNSAWTYSPLRYWPTSTDASVDFYAYAPFVENKALADAQGNIEHTPGALANQIDLSYAKVEDATSSTGNVTFNFKHALSRIGVKVKATKEEATVIKVTSVKLGTETTGFTNKANFNLVNQTWNEITGATSTDTYTLSSTEFAGDAATVTSNLTQLNNATSYLMLIPQTFTALPIEVVYTVQTSNGVTVTNTVSKTIALTLTQGKAYSINIDLTPTTIAFTASAETWATESNAETEANW